MSAYYHRTPEEAFGELESGTKGLSSAEAASRLEKYGANALAESKKKSIPRIFLEQFKDLLVVILAAAAVISMISGESKSTLVIFAVLLLNAVLGTVQTVKAEKSLASLKALSSPVTKVLRDGMKVEIPSSGAVPGDVLLLEAGDLVAADGRILENYSLKVNESSLTGESEAVEKSEAVLEGEKIPLGDQKNMVFSGSLVTYGRALVLVTGTGMDTELGKIAALMNRTEQRKTPLQESLDSFSKKLAAAILGVCAVVFALSLYRQMPMLDALMFAVALAVAAIPEALGSIVTIVLAIGTQKMARENAVIKDLKAVESLGSVSVICSDKTGTLTQNRMQAKTLYADKGTFSGEDIVLSNPVHRMLLKTALLTNDATTDDTGSIGDPTEIALVQLGDRLGVEETAYRGQHTRLGELAFDSDRKLMSTLHELEGKPTLLTKGAPDVLLSRCTQLMTAEGIRDLTDGDRGEILQTNREMSQSGLRVLAFACRELEGIRAVVPEDEWEFTFLGLVSMVDPPRPESIAAVADAKRGGVRTVMITGDHKLTASAIATQIGILEEGGLVVDGTELDTMTEEALDEALPKISVYARVSPEHKIRIVTAWQRRGSIVAMTGDGVNDAPALKKADIGVAMGITGTEVSKDAASMLLTDDNFATIVKAVVNGRNVFANIKNAIHFLLSGNTAGILCVLAASLLGLPMPFAPVHLLFINLLTDSLPAIAVGMEPARDDLLSRPPRDPKEPILNRPLLLQIAGQGLLIACAAMAAFFYGLPLGHATASTLAFAVLTLARLFHGFNCRGEQSVFRLGLLTNRFCLLAFGAGALLLSAVLFVPFLQDLFVTVPITAAQALLVLGLAFLPTAVIQIWKSIRR